MLFITLAWKTPDGTAGLPSVLYHGSDSTQAATAAMQSDPEFIRFHLAHVLFEIPFSVQPRPASGAVKPPVGEREEIVASFQALHAELVAERETSRLARREIARLLSLIESNAPQPAAPAAPAASSPSTPPAGPVPVAAPAAAGDGAAGDGADDNEDPAAQIAAATQKAKSSKSDKPK